MINLHNLSKIKSRSKKRLGRGHGSGRGKTAGRGTKGQRAREDIPLKLGLTGVSYVRRLPLFRGKFRNKPHGKKPFVVNVKYLNLFSDNSVVDLDSLIKINIVNSDIAKKHGVKILGNGDLSKKLIVKIVCSKGAIKKIEKAGGKVQLGKNG